MKTFFTISSLLHAGVFAEEEPAAEGLAAPKGDFDEAQRKALEENGEKHEFQAEVSRLMDIIINSLYGEREVFIRELVSNSVDAVEKARYLAVDDPAYLESKKELEIKVSFDKEAKTVSIVDTGCGMTKADLINNLGTVAKSGTTNFLEALKEGADASLIGQFGVGFYSAFLVADKIQVISKHNSDPTQHIWESSADASFFVAPDPRGNTLGRGSEVKLFLKEDATEFLSEAKLKELALKYSKFAPFPIYLKTEKEVEEEDDDDDDDDEPEVKDEDDDDEPEEKKEKPKKIVHEWELLNEQKPIWLQPKEDISEADYLAFYKTLSGSYDEPLSHTHFSAEGDIEFHSIVYIPKKVPSAVTQDFQNAKSDIQLYVRRVLVSEKLADFLPKYLNFVVGVVDSDDLPLNVSRDQLQQNKVMKVISKKLTRKVLDMLKKMSLEDDKSSGDDDDDDDDEKKDDKKGDEEKKDEKEEEKVEKKDDDKDSKYITFYKEFEYLLKIGCMDDDSNRSKISKLMRFVTTKSEGKLHSMNKIVKNKKEGQESIYYIQGESLDILEKKNNLQYFKENDIEVLLLTGKYDESCLQRLGDYEGMKLVSVQKADITVLESAEEKKKFKKLEEMYKPLTSWWTDILKKDTTTANKVVLSKRLTTMPVVIVASQSGYSAEMERLYASELGARGQDNPKKVLEVNAKHPLIKDLLKKVTDDKENATAKKSATMLFTTALLQAGYDVKDTVIQESFTSNLYNLMSAELGVDPKAEVVDIEVPDDEEEEEEEEEEGEKEKEKENKEETHDEL